MLPDDGELAYPNACAPDDIRDVQLSLRLEKGGAPASEKIFMGILNQEQPSKTRKTVLSLFSYSCRMWSKSTSRSRL